VNVISAYESWIGLKCDKNRIFGFLTLKILFYVLKKTKNFLFAFIFNWMSFLHMIAESQSNMIKIGFLGFWHCQFFSAYLKTQNNFRLHWFWTERHFCIWQLNQIIDMIKIGFLNLHWLLSLATLCLDSLCTKQTISHPTFKTIWILAL